MQVRSWGFTVGRRKLAAPRCHSERSEGSRSAPSSFRGWSRARGLREQRVRARFLPVVKMHAPKAPWSAVPHGGTALQGASRILILGGEPQDHEVCARNDIFEEV